MSHFTPSSRILMPAGIIQARRDQPLHAELAHVAGASSRGRVGVWGPWAAGTLTRKSPGCWAGAFKTPEQVCDHLALGASLLGWT
jgi:hypothetical protein